MADTSIRVGRIAPNMLTNVQSQRISADVVEYTGNLAGGNFPRPSFAELIFARDQVIGLGDNLDEPFVPLIDEKNPSLTGMVRVRSASADVAGGDLDPDQPWGGTFSLVLERAGTQPNIESTLWGGWRQTATVSTSLPTPWHAVPAAALDYYDGIATFQTLPTVRASETGDVAFYRNAGFGAGYTGVTVARFSCPEANWYDGAARVEMLHGAGLWHDIVGRHLPPTPDGLTKARSWRLTNGLVRVAPSATGGTLEVQAYSGGAWGTAKVLEFGANDGTTGYTINRIHTVAVRRNSPEQAIVRLTVGMTSGGIDYPHRVVLDLSLRRGDRLIDGRLSMPSTSTAALGSVVPSPTEAGTALTGNGGGRTDTAVNSNRFVLLTPAGTSFSTGTSQLNSTGSGNRKTAWSFGIGWEIGGSGSADPERATDLRNQYFAPLAERMTVVGW